MSNLKVKKLTKRKIDELLREKFCRCATGAKPLPPTEFYSPFGRSSGRVVCSSCGYRRATQSVLDARSRPLRDALSAWASQRGLGFGGGWEPKEKLWRYSLYGVVSGVSVKVAENGSVAYVRSGLGADSRVVTPRGLRAVLSRICAKLESSA